MSSITQQPIALTPVASCTGGCRTTKLGTGCAFFRNGTCSKTLMTVLDREYDNPMEVEERATHPLAGGLMQGYQCGMLWGASLAAGAQAYKLHGAGAQAEGAAMRAAQRLIDTFRGQLGHIDCIDITGTDPNNVWQIIWHFFIKGGTFKCAFRAANFVPKAFSDINAGLAEEHSGSSCDPVSCAATLARKMGASDKHATMAAGFAGGIGFSGSACGALGAAIWLIGVKGLEADTPDKVTNKRISEVIESFLKASGHELECSEIVGRKFEDVDDHAEHVRTGGCAELIDALAQAARGALCLEGERLASADSETDAPS